MIRTLLNDIPEDFGQLRELLTKITASKEAICAALKSKLDGRATKVDDGPLTLESISRMIQEARSLLEIRRFDVAEGLLDRNENWIIQVRNSMALNNRGLARRRILHEFHNRLKNACVREEDAEQDCFISLMRAAMLYDFTSGVAFSTYAYQWMRSPLYRTLLHSSLIHTPTYLTIIKDDKADAFQGHRKAFREKVVKARRMCSIDRGDFLHAACDDSHEREQAARENLDEIGNFLVRLPKVWRRILELRYLVGLSHNEIAKMLQAEGLSNHTLSRQRIRQIEDKAIKYLRTVAGIGG